MNGRGQLNALFAHVHQPWRRLLAAIGASALKDSPLWVLPLVTARTVDQIAGHQTETLWTYATLGFVSIALAYPATQWWVSAYNSAVRDLALSLRTELLQKSVKGPDSAQSLHSATSASRIVRDVENVELMLHQSGNPILVALGTITGAGVVVLISAPAFLPVLALVLPLTVALVRWVNGHWSLHNEAFRWDMEILSVRASENAQLLPLIRAHGLEKQAVERVLSAASRARDSGLVLDKFNGRFGAIAWVTFQTLSLGILFAAALLAPALSLTPGTVVLLSTYFVVITNAVLGVLGMTPLISRGLDSLKALGSLDPAPVRPAERDRKISHELRGDVTLRNVSFSYSDRAAPALRDVSLAVQAGSTVAVVGRSGAGKSTLVNVVLGILRPQRGAVLLDGIPVDDWYIPALRERISVVPQEPILFADTLRNNLVFGLDDVSEESIWCALEDAAIDDEVRGFDEGLDAFLGERGLQLSGGQRQRVAIARALIRRPSLLILDEATSALDTITERAFQNALKSSGRSTTVIVIAHRLSTIQSADQIFVLDNGKLAETGTHESLRRPGTLYCELLEAQSFGR